jgi:hypothetical protein
MTSANSDAVHKAPFPVSHTSGHIKLVLLMVCLGNACSLIMQQKRNLDYGLTLTRTQMVTRDEILCALQV